MKTPHRYAGVLRAIANGEQMQWKNSSGHWTDCDADVALRVMFDSYELRIKPEPKPDIVWYVNIYKDGIGGSHKTLDSALAGFEVPPFGTVKITINGETGKTSAEVV